ncbi:hypothetical protein OG552_22860 [Streptomyces sp. NBC_01476]|uniref:hypothetical protein n=1 Tax=Streptomyces sp. NBC_01476 TaxID=2903881 RepID=UPI002E339737|nr:hypothetical protein [Streptomyces sp. NBC_01476]
MNVKIAKRAAVAGGIAALSVGLMISPAQADPTSPNTFRQLVGVGSDTTQDVMNGLAETITDPNHTPSNLLVASYNATNPGYVPGDPAHPLHDTIVTRSGHAAIARPDGSGAGISTLIGDTAALDVDFARSSNGPSTVGTNLTFIPYALDAVTYAVRSSSALNGGTLSLAEVTNLYKCKNTDGSTPAGTFPAVGGVEIHPLLPQVGSGTRKFWEATLGLSDSSLAPCVSDVAADGTSVQEHNGTALQRAGDLMPFSIASYIAQTNHATTGVQDRRGTAVLQTVNGTQPETATSTLNTAFPVTREVYNVFRTSRLTETDIRNTFVAVQPGESNQSRVAKLCTPASGTIIEKFGFAQVANCGVITIKGNS